MDRRLPSRPTPSLRHLEVFHWVMTCGTQAEAARRMGTSQPALSRDLAQLERLLGHRLFERRGRRLVASHEAEQLHRELSTSYQSIERLLQMSAELLAGTGGHLRIGSVPSLGLAVIPRAIQRMALDAPRCRFELLVHTRDEISRLLAEGGLDVAFTVLGPQTHPTSADHLIDAEAVCVMHASSRLADLQEVWPTDIADQPYISLAAGYLSRLQIDAIFLRAGVRPDVFLTTQTAVSACGVIRSGHGVTVIDPFTAAACASPELVIRPFRPSMRFTYVVASPARATQRALVAALLTHVVTAFTDPTLIAT